MSGRRSRGLTRRPVARRRTSRHDLRIGVPLIILALLLLAALFGSYAVLQSNRTELDAETGCPVKGPSKITAILFDRTDAIDEKQKLYLQNKLYALLNNTQKFEEIDTYGLEGQGDDVVKPLLRLCNPGNGADASSLISNPELLQERWRNQFESPLLSMMKRMEEGGGSKTSAIFEAVQSVSLQSFQRSGLARDTQRRLIIISDLIQFTKSLNFYKSDLNYDSFRLTDESRRLHTTLTDTIVNVFFIPRARFERTSRLVNFWTSWFVEQGARKEGFTIFWVEG